MSEDVAEDFKCAIHEGLRAHACTLIAVLRQIVTHEYPWEVVTVNFEVFPDSWSSGFPARAFFLDESNTEYFVFVEGKARYPSAVDPGLLKIPYIISHETEESFRLRNPYLDTFTVGAEEFILWFAECWRQAGGLAFPLRATIADHDGEREFILVTNEWQDRYSAF
jgi:hypothetical protein